MATGQEKRAKRYNIRMAGIGGQGVVTASHVLANGVILWGGESTLVPFFGSEKRMAPVESYVRIAEDKIYEIGEIIYPNALMIFHPQVITHGKSYTNPFFWGLKKSGRVLINSEEPMKMTPEHQAELDQIGARLMYIPATKLAVEHAGTELATNMGMVGAMSAVMGMPTLDALQASVKERFLGKGFVVSGGTAALDNVLDRKFTKKAELIEKNFAVVKAAWEFVIAQGWAGLVQDQPQAAAVGKSA